MLEIGDKDNRGWLSLVGLMVAPLVAFFINSVRIAILAILVANQNQESFNYWHGDEGGWLFSAIAITIYASFCWYIFIHPLLTKLI